jgi:hypothetical protein
MRPRLSKDLWDAIAADLRATIGTPEGSQRRVAKRHGVGVGTVAKISKACDFEVCERAHERTELATRASAVDKAARRAEIESMLLERAREALEDMDREALVYNFGGKDNTYNERHLSRPDFRARLDLMRTAESAMREARAIAKHDSDVAGVAAVDAWLKAMLSEGGSRGTTS